MLSPRTPAHQGQALGGGRLQQSPSEIVYYVGRAAIPPGTVVGENVTHQGLSSD